MNRDSPYITEYLPDILGQIISNSLKLELVTQALITVGPIY